MTSCERFPCSAIVCNVLGLPPGLVDNCWLATLLGMRHRLARMLAAVLTLTAAGCATHPVASRPAAGPVPSTTPGASCLTPAERAGVIRFPSDNGASIAGVLLGASARVGFVLAHESGTDMCVWVPYGRKLAAAGYLVLAIDLNGYGASSMSAGFPSDARWDRDVVAAAAQLRRRGAHSVVLMGASLGGVAVVAAAHAVPPPVAVVDVSGEDDLSGVDALGAAPRVTAPMLFIGATDDPMVAAMRTVSQAATRAAVNHLELVPGANHGVALLDPALEPQAARLSALILDFTRQNTGQR